MLPVVNYSAVTLYNFLALSNAGEDKNSEVTYMVTFMLTRQSTEFTENDESGLQQTWTKT
jgi:hypothetical protein